MHTYIFLGKNVFPSQLMLMYKNIYCVWQPVALIAVFGDFENYYWKGWRWGNFVVATEAPAVFCTLLNLGKFHWLN